jgi:DUF4097 and DUF4098 domain-containing protein YvlB
MLHDSALRTLSSVLIRTAIISLFPFASFYAFARTEDNVQKQLTVSPGGQLVVDVDFGSIEVSAGGDNQVSIEAHRVIDTHNEAEEREFLLNAPILVTQEGNTVTVSAKQNVERNWNWDQYIMTSARYVIHTPKPFNAQLNTHDGKISVNELAGKVAVQSNGGDLNFARVRGAIDGQTDGGQVKVTDCNGTLRISTSGGDIEGSGGSGSLDACTSGGSITVRPFAGPIKTETGGGNLNLDKIETHVTGKTSGGSIRVSLGDALSGDVQLETSGGDVEVAVPPAVGLTLDAAANGGRIISDLPFRPVAQSEYRLQATINGGGRSLTLKTSSGDIHISQSVADTTAP